jgi:hypothetical protein
MTLPRVAPFAILLLLAACETTNSSDWIGGEGTPFKQAERSCNELLPTISKEEDRRAFFIGCMRALGWTPKAGASVDL